MTKKILLAIPSIDGKIASEVTKFILSIFSHLPNGYEVTFTESKRLLIHSARNLFLEQTVKGGYDYLWFVDDDNWITNPETIASLFTEDKDIVTCAIRCRNDKEGKLNIQNKERHESGMDRYVSLLELPTEGDERFEVDVTGFGCVVLSRKVCTEMMTKYNGMPFENKQIRYVKTIDESFIEFHPGIDSTKIRKDKDGRSEMRARELSEDFLFCERARKLGYRIRCNRNIKTAHIGPSNLLTT